MLTVNDVHQQFAEYFNLPGLKPYAYLLSRKLRDGHICLDLNTINVQPEEIPDWCRNLPRGDKPLRSIPLVARNGDEKQPFVLHNNHLYIQRYFRYETGFINSILNLLNAEQKAAKQRLAELNAHTGLINKLLTGNSKASAKENTSDELTDWQVAAAISGILNNFTIITGGPGTGKTTTVAKILSVLFTIHPNLKVALAAPTGKAAARMAESLRNTKIPLPKKIAEKFQALAPATIHRLLKWQSGTPYFRFNRNNPLHHDVVIIDECSMIDLALFAKLLEAIGPDTRIILLGDKDQLASVEAGSLFGDLCNSLPRLNFFTKQRAAVINRFISDPKRYITPSQISKGDAHPLFEHLVELKQSHRFATGYGIGQFSKAIISGDMATLQQPNEQVMIDTTYSTELFEKFVAGYAAFIKEKNIREALRKMNMLRVLCAVRETDQGLYAANNAIERLLHDRKLIAVNSEFYENRPIILTRNYYEYNLFNGDVGIIRRNHKGVLMAWFEDSAGELKSILPGYLSEAETVFAMTIHKSQGSEYDEVLVVLPARPDISILTRELLYTAVTRAKKRVYIQGSMEVIATAASRRVERVSGIAARFPESK
jgi:exodeoxyribonuclease V alpha subunit